MEVPDICCYCGTRFSMKDGRFTDLVYIGDAYWWESANDGMINLEFKEYSEVDRRGIYHLNCYSLMLR